MYFVNGEVLLWVFFIFFLLKLIFKIKAKFSEKEYSSLLFEDNSIEYNEKDRNSEE